MNETEDLERDEEKQLIAEEEKEGGIRDWDLIWNNLDFIYEKLDQHKKALGFIADRVQDKQASANLAILEIGLERILNHLDMTIGREPQYKDDVPY